MQTWAREAAFLPSRKYSEQDRSRVCSSVGTPKGFRRVSPAKWFSENRFAQQNLLRPSKSRSLQPPPPAEKVTLLDKGRLLKRSCQAILPMLLPDRQVALTCGEHHRLGYSARGPHRMLTLQ